MMSSVVQNKPFLNEKKISFLVVTLLPRKSKALDPQLPYKPNRDLGISRRDDVSSSLAHVCLRSISFTGPVIDPYN